MSYKNQTCGVLFRERKISEHSTIWAGTCITSGSAQEFADCSHVPFLIDYKR